MKHPEYFKTQEYIRKELLARELSGLYEKLHELVGCKIGGRYLVGKILAVGSQGILYNVSDLRKKKENRVIKFAFQQYHLPASFGVEDVRAGRRIIRQEMEYLRLFSGTPLPKLHDFLIADNPLHDPGRGKEIGSEEPFIVMELIEGISLDLVIRFYHNDDEVPYKTISEMGLRITEKLFSAFIILAEKDKGFFYSDLRPSNILIAKKSRNDIRLVDAGSIAPCDAATRKILAFSPDYIPPETYEQYKNGKEIEITEKTIISGFGRILHELATNKTPMPSEKLNHRLSIFKRYSAPFAELVKDFETGRYSDFKSALHAVREVKSKLK